MPSETVLSPFDPTSILDIRSARRSWRPCSPTSAGEATGPGPGKRCIRSLRPISIQCQDSGFQRAWLEQNLNFKGWNSHVHIRSLPGPGGTKRATSVNVALLRLRSSEGKFTMSCEIESERRSFCRHEVARLRKWHVWCLLPQQALGPMFTRSCNHLRINKNIDAGLSH